MRNTVASLRETRDQLLDPHRSTAVLRSHVETREAIDYLLNCTSWRVSATSEIKEGIANLKIRYQISATTHNRCVSCVLKKYFPFFVGEPRRKFGAILNRRAEREMAALVLLRAHTGPVKVPTLLSTNREADWNLMLAIEPALPVSYLEFGQIEALGKQLADFRSLRGFPSDLVSENLVNDTISYRQRLGRVDLLPKCIARSLGTYLADPYVGERTFVHGDVTTKNLLCTPVNGCLWLLDFEQANYGDPLSDLGFLASDLAVAELRREADGWLKRVEQRLSSLFESYWKALNRVSTDLEERRVFLHFVLGCLYRSETLQFLPGPLPKGASARLRHLAMALLSAESPTLLHVSAFDECPATA